MSTTWTSSVNPQAKFILVIARIVGPRGRQSDARLIIDPGSPVTILRTDLATLIDLTAGPGSKPSHLRGPVGPQEGYARAARSLAAMGGSVANLWIHCHDLDEDLKIDGVIGLDVIRRGDLRICLPRGYVSFDWLLHSPSTH